jgi:hypothetical protein
MTIDVSLKNDSFYSDKFDKYVKDVCQYLSKKKRSKFAICSFGRQNFLLILKNCLKNGMPIPLSTISLSTIPGIV